MNSQVPRGEAAHQESGLLRPLEKFLHVEAFSGLVLLAVAVAAMLWANSRWADAYHRLWELPLTLGAGTLVVTQSLHFWVNDGLMTIFFLVVALEIRRELHEGALASARVAALPVAAALGGILVPAVIYLAVNPGAPFRDGWAIPTATDIAFAIGVLALLGRRVPMALRILLLALAIIDDIAAIIVITLFYSQGLAPAGLLVAGLGVGLVFLCQRLGLRTAWPYVLPGGVIWAGLLLAGIHPSLAGVVCGLLTPVQLSTSNPLARAARALEQFTERARGTRDPEALLPPYRALRDAQLGMLSPVVRVQAALHPWVAFGIMPLFALANAGVTLDGSGVFGAGTAPVHAGIIGGLVLGKPLGVMLATWIAVRMRWCALPEGVGWSGVAVVATLAGIGFTMSIFIANLAFGGTELLAPATLAVLIGSTASGVIGLVLGGVLRLGPAPAPSTAQAAEGSQS